MVRGVCDVKMDELEGFVQSLKGMSAAQLMEKKDAIERDMKEFSDILQAVSVYCHGDGDVSDDVCFSLAARWCGHEWTPGGP